MSTVQKTAIAALLVAVVLAGGLYLWQRPTSRRLVVGNSVTFMSVGTIQDVLDRRVARFCGGDRS